MLQHECQEKLTVELDVVKWQSLKFRQQIWKFLKVNVTDSQWQRYGNVFEFFNSRDAVIFKLYWS